VSNFNAFWVLLGKFYTANKDIINTLLSGSLPVIVPAGIGLIWWYRQQRRQRQLPTPSSPFECIPPRSEVLERVYSGDKNNPLADFNIPYQSRQINRNIRRELEQELEKTGWLLILGRTGIGKTREAAELVQLFNHEGWTVLRLKVGEWVDVPTREQLSEIGTNRKLLFFLNDLNQPMHYSNTDEISPKAKEGGLEPINIPLQKRLLQTLEAYEEFCGKPEMRVIATARNETQPTEPGKPSELEKLKLKKYPQLWQRFTYYELPEPSDEAVVQLLTDVVPKTHIYAKEENYLVIAQRNDGTFRNVVENLVRLRNRQLPLTPQNYRDTLQATWENRYQDVMKCYPISASIYDAIELLRLCGLPLERVIIEPTALLFCQGSFWQRWVDRWKIRQALTYLIEAESILNPRDGQIEGKGKPINVEKYIQQFTYLILKLAKIYPHILFGSLLDFGLKLASEYHHPKEALTTFDKILEFDHQIIPERNLKIDSSLSSSHFQDPNFIDDNAQLALLDTQLALLDTQLALLQTHQLALIWISRGLTLFTIERYEEAIASYNKALEIKPDYYEAWSNRGLTFFTIERYEEAIASYNKALEIKPDDYETWIDRGWALFSLKRYEEAITSYNKALEIKIDFPMALYYKGFALFSLKRYEEAITSYNKALEIKPDFPEAWNDQGFVLFCLRRYEEAIVCYNKALEIKPAFHLAWYNKACCYALQGNIDLALENFQQAIHLNSEKCRQMAETDSDFDSIRGDSRFQALMQGKQESKK
jgi:tetratricopeptide (TPR) repeat protein